jgi:hypothetical protein
MRTTSWEAGIESPPGLKEVIVNPCAIKFENLRPHLSQACFGLCVRRAIFGSTAAHRSAQAGEPQFLRESNALRLTRGALWDFSKEDNLFWNI